MTVSPVSILSSVLRDPVLYTRLASGVTLHPWQCSPIPRLLDSITNHLGDTLILFFPRQSGKDEFLVHLKLWLLDLYSTQPVSIVEVNPTYKPQTTRALLRFDSALQRNPLTRSRWCRRGEFIRLLGNARVSFLSGDSSSRVLGDTASLLLIVNEAQELSPLAYHKNFVPMTASTNATRLLAGTAWDASTLLSEEVRRARDLEKKDGRQRLFTVSAEEVGKFLPAYARHVEEVVSHLGRDHPLVRTQYFNEEIASQSPMFTDLRMALIHSIHPSPNGVFPFGEGDRRSGGVEGGLLPEDRVGFLLDVAGQDESLMSDPFASPSHPARDSVALSIVEIDLSTIETLRYPSYRVIRRFSWLGDNHLTVFNQLKVFINQWRPLHIVIDATGVGEGLWALLDKDFHTRLHPVKYTSAVKSDIGYTFLSIINTGRFRDFAPDPRVEAQYRACQAEALPGPSRLLRWGVPDSARTPDGHLIHDDFLMADSLVAVLDNLSWTLSSPTSVLPALDPLERMSRIRDLDFDELRRFEY